MNTPSYNALVSKDRLIKTVIELCEEVNKGEGGGGGGESSDFFIYELDISGINMSPGTYPIQDANLVPAIHDAYNAGKQVYISASTYPGAYTILPLASIQSASGMEGYVFMTTTLGGDPPKYHNVVNLMITVVYSEQQSQSFLTVSITGTIETRVVNHGTSKTTFTLPANEYHIWGTVASLNITLAAPENSYIVNEYMFQFTSGSTATTLSLPNTVKWIGGTPVIEANTTYQVSIINDIAVIGGAQ